MLRKLLAFAVVALLLASPVIADWTPSDGHKMHFPQPPDSVGWNVDGTDPGMLADDWMCSETGPVSEIHFWGSWKNGLEGSINGFTITIYTDVPNPGGPGDYSQPGIALWSQYFMPGQCLRQYIEPVPQMWEGWYEPTTGTAVYPDHDYFYGYNISGITDPFIQTQGEIYWISIVADVVVWPDPQPVWGWKSSTVHWNDNAVYVVPDVLPGSCNVPDNGTGTVSYSPPCDFTSPAEVMMIIDGLPPGSTIEMDAVITDIICSEVVTCSEPIPPLQCEAAGGSLGGTVSCFEAVLDIDVSGTGMLAGFNRHLWVPVTLEVHLAPRNPGDPIQAMDALLFRMYGELFGDPDFCTLRFTGGNDFGLPSPGHVTMTEVGDGTFNIDSFFDITYQIEFEGCPGSMLDGFAGTTTATIRYEQGDPGGKNAAFAPAPLLAGTCEVPDNGTGTITYPPMGCDFTSPLEDMMIIDGLPPGTTIDMADFITDFFCPGGGTCSLPIPPGQCEIAGGSLGGTGSCFEATLDLTLSGTGDLQGFSRHLAVPVFMEVHLGPRNPGDPIQSMAGDVFRLQGELFGDPDFCTFRVTGGTDFGLPSPGQCELARLPNGNFNVDSFFDITYQIEFEGCPGSQLEGLAGTTTATIRMEQGSPPTSDVNWFPMDEPVVSAPITNGFAIDMDPGGGFIGGFGENAYGDGWYFYPENGWWNVWFYDHPVAFDRYKVIHIEFDAFPLSPGPAMLELAANWSTDIWSIEGNPPGDRRPPLPEDGNEELFIGRQTLFFEEVFQGHYAVDWVVDAYNPEWVSIDVRGFNFSILNGLITHECMARDPEQMDLAFVVNDTPASCCRLRGDVNHDGSDPDIADLIYMVSYMFQGGPVPPCNEPYLPECPTEYYPEADINGDGSCTPDIADLIYLVTYMFQDGPIPPPC